MEEEQSQGSLREVSYDDPPARGRQGLRVYPFGIREDVAHLCTGPLKPVQVAGNMVQVLVLSEVGFVFVCDSAGDGDVADELGLAHSRLNEPHSLAHK